MSAIRYNLGHVIEKVQEMSQWVDNEAGYISTLPGKRAALHKAKYALDEAVRELGWADLALGVALEPPRGDKSG